jgi:hypothetical protein
MPNLRLFFAEQFQPERPLSVTVRGRIPGFVGGPGCVELEGMDRRNAVKMELERVKE